MAAAVSQADVMRAFLQVSLDYGQELLAGKLDVKVSTLSNKLQPYDHAERRHYLNLWEADDMLTLGGDMRPLELLAARHGFLLVPMNAVPDAPTLDAEKVQDVQTLAKFQAESDPLRQIHAMNAHIREVLETQTKREEEGTQPCKP